MHLPVNTCPNCNSVIQHQARFCNFCGARINENLSNPLDKQPPQPPQRKRNTQWKKVSIIVVVGSFLLGVMLLSSVLIIGIIKDQSPFAIAADVARLALGFKSVAEAESIIYEQKNEYLKNEQKEIGEKIEINQNALESLIKLENPENKPSEPFQSEDYDPDRRDCLSEENFSIGSQNPLENIKPIINKPVLKNHPGILSEGVWVPISISKAAKEQPIFYKTVIRPDEKQPWSRVELVLIRMRYLELGLVGGSSTRNHKSHKRASGKIPSEKLPNWVASFNGGFQQNHAKGGIIIRGKEFVPMVENRGTITVGRNHHIQIFNYKAKLYGEPMLNMFYARQNQPILVEDGYINESVKKWGWVWVEESQSSSTQIKAARKGYGWRSGLGKTKYGDLIYAVGNNITAHSLARALVLAGSENAIHLDMNPAHVIFCVYYLEEGKLQIKKIAPTLTKLSNRLLRLYIKGYERDYFYLTRKVNSKIKHRALAEG